MHRRSTIDRYLAGDLPDAAEARLRAHLSGCARCRAYFDEQIALLRALAGDASRPTPAEGVRMVRRALASAGLSLPPAGGPTPRAERRASWLLRPAAAAAAVCVLIGAAVLWQRLRTTPPAA
ncbi:MAG: zf-HC2 domain-containing protein, partial [Deltaproteobacteria bacterium]|nr:zf-HC2 domain-containing protein [Deltaproteobacteria bacterium]